MKQRYQEVYDDDLLRDRQRLRGAMFATDGMRRGASPRFPRVHDGTGDSGLAMHRPGFRVTDVPPSDELQRAHDAYERSLTTAWRRGKEKEEAVPETPRASESGAIPVPDIEAAYRLYAEEISPPQKTR